MEEEKQGIPMYQTDEWVNTIFLCLNAIKNVLTQNTTPTKETAETVRLLVESAVRLTYL